MYRWVEHTAELELAISADTEEAVLADALAALAELQETDEASEPARREISLEASDRPALLAAWLDELVYLAESEGFVAERLETLELAGTRLRALVEGRRGEPRPLVKGVTYHRLEFDRHADGWRARAVLDV